MAYPPEFVEPGREELNRAGFTQLLTAEAVEALDFECCGLVLWAGLDSVGAGA